MRKSLEEKGVHVDRGEHTELSQEQCPRSLEDGGTHRGDAGGKDTGQMEEGFNHMIWGTTGWRCCKWHLPEIWCPPRFVGHKA